MEINLKAVHTTRMKHKQVHLEAGTPGATSKQRFESVPRANFVSLAFLSAQMLVPLWNETPQRKIQFIETCFGY